MENAKKVSFEVKADDMRMFETLEAIALSTDERLIGVLSEMVKHFRDNRRKRTDEELLQRADWMKMRPEELAR